MSKKLPPHIESMLRVNQAGEYGAIRIYQGQLKTLQNSSEHATIKEMEEGEKKHLSTFNQLMVEHQVHPTLFTPLWHVGGFLMGAVTGMLGKKAAHTCTKAVEEVIEQHYQSQIDALEHDLHPLAQELRETFIQFRKEEIEHRDIAQERGASNDDNLLSRGIKMISTAAIEISKRL